MQQQSPFIVSEQNKTRGRVRWNDAEEQRQFPRVNFDAAMALAKNKAISQEVINEQLLPALTVLPGRCYASPLVCMLTFNERVPYVPLVTTTLVVLWQLIQFRLFFEAKYVGGNKKNIALGKRLLRYTKTDFFRWSQKQDADLESYYHEGKRDMNTFATLLWQHTQDLIAVLEELVYDCVCIHFKCKPRFERSSRAMVPVDYPYDSEKEEAQETLNMQNFFQSKQSYIIADARLDENKKLRADYVDIKPCIQHELVSRVMGVSRDNDTHVYRRYIPYITLQQYAKLLDVNKVWG